MKFLVKAAVAAAALGLSAAASADQFDFSYTFVDGQQVTGSFTGTAGADSTGALDASNISDIQASFAGNAFTGPLGPLVLNGWDTSAEQFTAPSASATIYSTLSENNFAISDVDLSQNVNFDYLFTLTNDPAAAPNALVENQLVTDAFGNVQFDSDGETGVWSLTDAGPSPVPVPAALPLLLSGLGMFGLARRRKSA